ncbi:MAG: hypothetical protein EHM64_14355 [Ignavibacteriae bacterium]|nr:MAG: hypothetical protein EHM64_14355 [Ignavibacteriota bacterium]
MGKGSVKQKCRQPSVHLRIVFTPASLAWKGIVTVFCLSMALAQPSLKVRSISFFGNHKFSDYQLASTLSGRGDSVYSESAMDSGLDRVLDLYRHEAYLHACVDSIRVKSDTLLQEIDVRVFLNEGKPSVVRQIEFSGCRNLTDGELSAVMNIHPGDLFIPPLLEQDIQSILHEYDRRGYPLAKASIQNISFIDSSDEMAARIQIHIDEGKEMHIAGLRIEGNQTTKDFVIIREARLKQNEVFRSDLPLALKRRLDRLQIFSSVSLPELTMIDSEQAGLSVRVVEGNQNSFDGVLGYVPSSGLNGTGTLTGLVNISLRNLFGTGRKLSARWFQENKSSQETELHYLEPWIASAPVNLQVGFFQRKQDSTFVKQQYDVAAELMLTDELTVGAKFSQCGVYPTAGFGQTVMADSRTSSFGITIRYDSRDNPATPSRGIFYSTEYFTGSKKTGVGGIAPVGAKTSTQSLVFDFSFYRPTFLRQVLAAELHLRGYSSNSLDAADVFRIGGASTLRGYREGQFLGSRVAWSNFEYRFLVAPRSYFYGFVDLGHIVQPSIIALGMTASEQSKIGYGIGVRLDSALGLIGVSFAFGEGDTFSTSKIHIRLMNEF